MNKETRMMPSKRRLILHLGAAFLIILAASGSNSAEAAVGSHSDGDARHQQLGRRNLAAPDGSLAAPQWRRWTAKGDELDDVMAANEARSIEVLDLERREATGYQSSRSRREVEPKPVAKAMAMAAAKAAAAPTAADPLITPPPELRKRQDNNGQVQALSGEIQRLSESFRSVSQASQQVSQSSQQLSQSVQQLTQSTQRLSQELQRAQESARQQGDSARQAQESARQAGEAASRASASADSAVSAAQSSASSAIAANLASATSSAAASAASIMSAASRSAQSIMDQAASMVQAAKADATIARADANNQVQQAQGAAVSVTQAALAVVGTFIGSSLLSIAVFYLILRYRQNRQAKRLRASNISYPRGGLSRKGTEAGFGAAPSYMPGGGALGPNGYLVDVKEPMATARSDGGGPYSYANRRSSSSYGNEDGGPGGVLVGNPPPAKFSLFPRASVATMSPLGIGSAVAAAKPSPRAGERASGVAPSLEKWLRAGTVSPFGTLVKNSSPPPAGTATTTTATTATKVGGGSTSTTTWPFESRDASTAGSGLPQRQRQGVGVGGPVMRPGSRLPLRDS